MTAPRDAGPELGPEVPVEVRPVAGRRDLEVFLRFPWTVYAGDPLWVPPLLPERRAALDPRRGELFRRGGEAAPFLARRGDRIEGTIAAWRDPDANRRSGRETCFFGFLEYRDDPEAAAALLDAAEAWGRSRGCVELYGPFNLDYENAYGVLVEGRDRPPALLCGHSPAYYLPTMERLGFEPARGDNLAFEVRLDKPVPDRDRLSRLAQWSRLRRGYTIRGSDFSRFEEEVDRVHDLLNRSLAHLPGFIGWERSAVRDLLAPFRRFADPDLILFAEKDGKTVGFFPAVPDLNEIFRTCDGFSDLRSTLAGLWRLAFRSRPLRPADRFPRTLLGRRYRCVTIKSVLVPPEHWNAGVAALLFDEMLRRLEGRGYEWIDLSLTSADNPNTPVLAERFGGRVYKRYRVFRRAIFEGESPRGAETEGGAP